MTEENRRLADEIRATIDRWRRENDPVFVSAELATAAVETAIRIGIRKEFLLEGTARSFDALYPTMSHEALKLGPRQ